MLHSRTESKILYKGKGIDVDNAKWEIPIHERKHVQFVRLRECPSEMMLHRPTATAPVLLFCIIAAHTAGCSGLSEYDEEDGRVDTAGDTLTETAIDPGPDPGYDTTDAPHDSTVVDTASEWDADPVIDTLTDTSDDPGADSHADPCSSPTVVMPNTTTAGSLVGAANNFSGSCGGGSGPDTVFQLSLSSDQDVFVAAFSTDFDPVLYMGTTCGGSETGCNDDHIWGEQTPVLINDTLTAGTYYIVVDSATSSGGGFSLEIYANSDRRRADTCGEPIRLQDGINGTTCTATHDYSPSCQGGGCLARDLVFYFVMQSPDSVTVETCHYTTDLLAAYRDVCTQDSPDLACNDDSCPGSDGARVGHTFSPGVYFLVLDGHCTGCGDYWLDIYGL